MTTTQLYDGDMTTTHSETSRLAIVYKYRCPECGQTFTDPEEYAYGHDCEAE